MKSTKHLRNLACKDYLVLKGKHGHKVQSPKSGRLMMVKEDQQALKDGLTGYYTFEFTGKDIEDVDNARKSIVIHYTIDGGMFNVNGCCFEYQVDGENFAIADKDRGLTEEQLDSYQSDVKAMVSLGIEACCKDFVRDVINNESMSTLEKADCIVDTMMKEEDNGKKRS